MSLDDLIGKIRTSTKTADAVFIIDKKLDKIK